MRAKLIALFLAFAAHTFAQDSAYTRQVLSILCSKKCFGRGYTRNGLETAQKFIVHELNRAGVRPFLPTGYTREFTLPVNTFPGSCKVSLNGRKLIPGVDFIVDPASNGGKTCFDLIQKDSVTFVGQNKDKQIIVQQKKKLTFSVASESVNPVVIELNTLKQKQQPRRIKVNIQSKFIPSFTSRNIIATLEGSGESDSMVVFTAHYDHLGGMGKKTWFPGANDNASGVSMVLNLARYYTKHPLRYRTVFIFFAGEEAGLIGSEYLVKSGIINLQKIKFLINLDLLGTGDDGIMVVNGAIHEKEFNTLLAINEKEHLVKEILKRGKAHNSDHYHFTEAGVKTFFIYTLGGTAAYHDVQDVEEKLPLTDYKDVYKLIIEFAATL